jgi:hypothetical protein
MELWITWYWSASQLSSAFSRKRTFLWFLVVLAGLSIREDLFGVTSIVRALLLKEKAYDCLLKFFHSDAVDLGKLYVLWTNLALKIFQRQNIGQYTVLLLDGLKVPKEGKKMPGVKSLHQGSQNNSKAEYIMGHSLQCLSILVTGSANGFAAVPLIAQIHEGLVWNNRDGKTLMDKAASLVTSIRDAIGSPVLIVADAYYANAPFIKLMISNACHVVSRVRNNASACYPPAPPNKRKRGRPVKYGKKIALQSLFEQDDLFTSITTSIYEEKEVLIRYYVINLIWKPMKCFVRFILVDHSTRGKAIFMTSDLNLDPLLVIRAYGFRFKIEVAFKSALHVIGTYAYHFWMKSMVPIKRFSGNQYMHKKTLEYRNSIKRKFNAYHIYIAAGCVAHGLILHLCMNHSDLVWKKFGSWMRTMKTQETPSEFVAANALRRTFPEYIAGSSQDDSLRKFLVKNSNLGQDGNLSLTG